jgi:hypothetical protein
MRSLRGVALLRRAAFQHVVDPNPLDDEHAILDLDIPFGLRREVALTSFDPTRLQRATQGAGQSTSRRRHDVVERRCVRLEAARRGVVVFGHLVVDAEANRIGLCRKIGTAQRSLNPLDPHPRYVTHVTH